MERLKCPFVKFVLHCIATRKKDKKESSSGAVEALVMRGRFQKKGKGKNERSKSRVGKDECAFCREKGHWKKDCPKLKHNSGKGKAVVDSNVAEYDANSNYSLTVGASSSGSQA
ncbi:Gag polyprotein [Euphorbia peplus]|nr:Gag polyprotein [Euphorbia peplus]